MVGGIKDLSAVRRAINDGNLPGARHLVEAALSLNPDDPQAILEYAFVCLYEHRREEAIGMAQAVLTSSTSTDLRIGACRILTDTGRLDLAKPALEQIAETEPNNVDALTALAGVLTKQNDFKSVDGLIDRMKGLSGDRKEFYWFALYYYSLRRSPKSCVIYAEEYLKLNSSPAHLLECTRLLRVVGEISAAERLLRRHGQRANRLTDVAWALLASAKGDVSAAEKSLKRAGRAAFENQSGLQTAGWVAFCRGDLKSAESLLEKVLEMNPHAPSALHLMAQIKLKQDRPQDAKAIAQLLTELLPNERVFRDLLAEASNSIPDRK